MHFDRAVAAGTIAAESLTVEGDNIGIRENEANPHGAGFSVVVTEWEPSGSSAGDDRASYTGTGGLVGVNGLPVAAFSDYPVTFV